MLKTGAYVLLSSAIFWLLGESRVLFGCAETALLVLFFLRPSRRITASTHDTTLPPVSIIVPMRNEEANAGPCVDALLALAYPDYEILVGDDSSTDRTREILDTHARASGGRLHVVSVPPIVAGWTGKTWATSELIKGAAHDLILVVDADVRHAPESLQVSVRRLLETRADIMIRFPYPVTRSVREWPILFLFFTLRFSAWFSLDLLKRREALAKEEYLLFTRDCYDRVGGYQSFKGEYPLILAFLAAAFKKECRVTVLDDDTEQVRATAYQDFCGTFRGITERINFRHVGFSSFFGIFAVILFSIDGVVRVVLGAIASDAYLLFTGMVSYLLFISLFGVYLYLSRAPLAAAPLAPFLGITFLIASLIAALRASMGVPLSWKGRTAHVR